MYAEVRSDVGVVASERGVEARELLGEVVEISQWTRRRREPPRVAGGVVAR